MLTAFILRLFFKLCSNFCCATTKMKLNRISRYCRYLNYCTSYSYMVKPVYFYLNKFWKNKGNVSENTFQNLEPGELATNSTIKAVKKQNKCPHSSEKATVQLYRPKYKRPVVLILIALSNKPLQLVTNVVTFKPVFPHFISSVITPVSLSLFVIVPWLTGLPELNDNFINSASSH